MCFIVQKIDQRANPLLSPPSVPGGFADTVILAQVVTNPSEILLATLSSLFVSKIDACRQWRSQKFVMKGF